VKRIAIPLFRAFAGVLVVGAILHVGSLLSSVLEVAATLPAGAWLFTGSYAACAFTALAACGLAVLLLWKASHKADGRALTLFLGFLAVFWGSFFRFLDVTATADDVAINLNYTGQAARRGHLPPGRARLGARGRLRRDAVAGRPGDLPGRAPRCGRGRRRGRQRGGRL
jgi:hypothetical protein